ncbi:hypothetical protein WH47_08746 [Habropoda laboriosa]|uniref:Uncharacterized protein n=1 Tax=Habropoda laboriosa TaxID=597456 RepID=A0A0L7QP11_9HYME|nr:hypothetical protein WH47_08746 [Habropoda laboriosa]
MNIHIRRAYIYALEKWALGYEERTYMFIPYIPLFLFCFCDKIIVCQISFKSYKTDIGNIWETKIRCEM